MIKGIKKKLCIFLSAVGCLCLGIASGGLFKAPKNEIAHAATTSFNTNSFAMTPQASLRLNAYHGIRFRTVIGDKQLESWGDDFTMGTIVIPEAIFLASGEKALTEDFSYMGEVPTIIEFDGDKSHLATDSAFPSCKVFNTVLHLNNYQATPFMYQQPLLARTFVKIGNTVKYADNTVSRSPAYVAAGSLDLGVEDTTGLLNDYLHEIESVNFATDKINVGVGDLVRVSADATPNGVFPIKYSTASANLEVDGDIVKGLTAGTHQVTASVAGGKVSGTADVLVVGNQGLERMYYTSTDEDPYLTFNAYNVDGVKYDGKTLTAGTDYTVDTDETTEISTVSVLKSALYAADRVNKLTLCSETSGDATVSIVYGYNTDALPDVLDYSDSNEYFDIYAYNAVRSSTITEAEYSRQDGTDGSEYLKDGFYTYDSGVDFMDEEHIQAYYDAGMEKLWAGSAATCGREYAYYTQGIAAGKTAAELYPDLYKVMDTAHAMGKDNSVIVSDVVLTDHLIQLNKNEYKDWTNETVYNQGNTKLVVTDDPTTEEVETPGANQFASEAALDAMVEKWLLRYCKHPAFGGIVIWDEPHMTHAGMVADMYKSVMRVYKKLGLTDKKAVVNMHPLYPNTADRFAYVGIDPESVNENNRSALYEAYKKYLDNWMTLSGQKELQIDVYSLGSTGIFRYHIVNLQIAAEVAAAHGAKLSIVNSAFKRTGGTSVGSPERDHSYNDMNWMNNVLMAYGNSNISYYTYNTLDDSSSQIVANNGSMVNRQGEQTEMYGYVKELNQKAQVLAPVLLNFKYVKGVLHTQTSAGETNVQGFLREYAGQSGATVSCTQKQNDTDLTFARLTKATSGSTNYSGRAWLINELYDGARGNYMYAVMNIYDTLNGATETQTITLTFKDGYERAWVYYDGAFTVMDMTSNQLTLEMNAGEAYYIIPFGSATQDPDYETTPGEGWGDVWGDGSNGALDGDDYVTKPGEGWGNVWGDGSNGALDGDDYVAKLGEGWANFYPKAEVPEEPAEPAEPAEPEVPAEPAEPEATRPEEQEPEATRSKEESAGGK